jgi:hypothetical protein
MKFALYSKLRAIGKPSSLLVCETDGLFLRGAVLARSGSEITIQYSAQSKLPGLEDAIHEVIDRLRAQGWKGSKAVLLTPGVVPALLELPVDPAKPRPPEQMEELVRWEMEPLLMQHASLWSMSRILVGMGYLTETQARAVADAQQGRGRPDNGVEVYAYRGFGDFALELGYITREQLDECQLRQEWLKSDSDEIACGWAPQVVTKGEGYGHRWMASAVNRALMSRWVSVFSRHGVKLQAMYPLAASAAALLPADDAYRLLLEAHGGVATATTLEGGVVTGFHIQPESLWMRLESQAGFASGNDKYNGIASSTPQTSPLSEALEACLEAYHALTPPEPSVLWLASPHEDTADLPARLHNILGRDVRVLAIKEGEHGGIATPGMLGAARHAMGLADVELCCDILVAGPRKPLMQRVEVRAVLAGLVLAVLIGGTELALQVRKDFALEKKARIDKEAAALDASIAAVKAEIERINKLQTKLKTTQNEAERAEARMRFFGEELPQRAAFVQSLLATLEQSVTEEVVIDRIEEVVIPPANTRASVQPAALTGVTPLPPGGFRINAWTLNETAAQQFVQAVKGAMQPWGMDVVEVTVIAQTGRLGLQGNSVSLRIVKPAPIPEPANPAVNGNQS